MGTPYAKESTRIAARSSMIDSLKGYGLAGIRIDKDELRRRISMPHYLCHAVRRSINSKDVSAGVDSTVHAFVNDGAVEDPESPMIVFVNSRSGGRHGPELKERLQQLMGEEQVFELSDVRPQEFVQYGLGCLEQLAANGDSCARDTRVKLRIVVAGGDGTVGWILGNLGELHKLDREPVPPVAIIPLGTGNDLSRSFGWGGSFPFAWKSAVKRSLHRACTGPVCRLDRSFGNTLFTLSGKGWHVTVTMPAGELVDLPHSMKHYEDCPLDQDFEGPLPEKVTCYDGVFYNYFSIGMDAQVAYGFHHLRNEKPYLAQGPVANKLIYSGYSCTQGWFCTPCSSDPGLRGLRNILKINIKRVNCSDWEEIHIPSNVRSIVALNLHSYASGRHPWGNLSPEYMERRGFVEAHADDGLLEIFGLKHGWHASFVMVELISAKHIAQAAAIRLEIRGADWKESFLQMDGEPWKQPLDESYSTFVDIRKVRFHSLVVSGDS